MDRLILRLAMGAVGFAAPAAAVHADIYRCIAGDGQVMYSDSPCPQGAAMASNITEAVQACTTPECAAQQERARAAAEERLRNERAMLNEMQERRLRSEALDLDMRVRRQELLRLQSMDATGARGDTSTYFPSVPLPYNGFAYDWYGTQGLPWWRNCRTFDCTGLRPLPSDVAGLRPFRFPIEQGSSFTLPQRKPGPPPKKW